MAKKPRGSAIDDMVQDAVADSSAQFFQRLVTALAERGVASTQSAIADLLKVRPSTLAAWASGTATPSVDRVLEIARASGVDTDWLLTGMGSPWRDPDLDELLRLFRKLPPDARSFVLQAARLAAGRAPRRRARPKR